MNEKYSNPHQQRLEELLLKQSKGQNLTSAEIKEMEQLNEVLGVGYSPFNEFEYSPGLHKKSLS